MRLLLVLVLVTLGINASAQSDYYCELKGSVYIEKDKSRADYIVYVEESEAFADMLVFKEENEFFADEAGLWFFTENRGLAEFRIYITDRKSEAHFSIFYTDAPSFAGCQ